LKPYGIIAEFETPAAILAAAKQVRDAGYRRWDIFTPFPIHGIDKVMGLKNSLVGWFSLAGLSSPAWACCGSRTRLIIR
jgi:hypothetical protein